MKRFDQLNEGEILALAIASEEEDARIYASYAMRLRADYPATARVLDGIAAEENGHRDSLLSLHERRFGQELPLVTRQDVTGFLRRQPLWLAEELRVEEVRRQIGVMELESAAFYTRAAARAQDTEVRRLLGDLALAERRHEATASALETAYLTESARDAEKESARRLLVLQVVQPALAGLIDGSVSTLAPIFAAAFATQSSHQAFLVGLAASIGAGISMGLTEAMSDDGAITGRGGPLIRGLACGVATTLGGLGHALPYLIPDFRIATAVAALVVTVELFAIAWVRWHFMGSRFHTALIQIVLGGALVVLVGVLIGSE